MRNARRAFRKGAFVIDVFDAAHQRIGRALALVDQAQGLYLARQPRVHRLQHGRLPLQVDALPVQGVLQQHGHFVVPWGGREGRLATNPLAFGAPTDGAPVVLDMSTSMISEGKIRVLLHAGQQVPQGRIQDADGNPTTEPARFYGPPRGTILPLGGEGELNSGYKGYGLALLVDILSAVLDYHRKRKFGGGCIFGNTALETGDSNPRFAAFVRAVFDEWTGLLARLLAGARDAGEIPNTIEPTAFARLIVASLEGGIMMARLSKNERDLIQCIDAIRSALGMSATTPGRRDITRKGKGKC